MLKLEELSFEVEGKDSPFRIIDEVSIELSSHHFMAIVGPSGCGKSTLLRTVAGLNVESGGKIWWNGKDIAEEGDFNPQEIGYVPQFSIAHEALTVEEALETALRLKLKHQNLDALDQQLDRILKITGLDHLEESYVKALSGGQKRRLGLALELVSNPQLLLCDEVTSGLDPRSEKEVMDLLHSLAKVDDRVVISVTHSLAHLDLYDSILVLHEGKVAYHGAPENLMNYFDVDSVEGIYPRLGRQSSEISKNSWNKHREHYYSELSKNHTLKSEEISILHTKEEQEEEKNTDEQEREEPEESPTLYPPLPSVFSQFITLLKRRFKLFTRDRAQLLLNLAVLIIFPVMVTIFAEQASEAPLKFPQPQEVFTHAQAAEIPLIAEQRGKLGGSLGGIVMFQIILLCLIGANNSAREIAGERQIWEKEKFGGISIVSYLLSKLAFLATLVVVQSVIMSVWVNMFWQFPGATEMGFLYHTLLLILANAAITSVCLGVSSIVQTPEQSSLISIYIVCFQLPLSGAILGLPDWLGPYVQPFISAYWAWSGSITSMKDSHRQTIISVIDTDFSSTDICIVVLSVHIVLGVLLAAIGAKKHRWNH